MENKIQDSVNREIELMQIGMVWYVQNKNGQKNPSLYSLECIDRGNSVKMVHLKLTLVSGAGLP